MSWPRELHLLAQGFISGYDEERIYASSIGWRPKFYLSSDLASLI